MKLPYSEPDPAGSERARKAKSYRDLATEVSRLQPQALTRTNEEETDHGNTRNGNRASYPANFTKGLTHDECGLLENSRDYAAFVEAINAPDPTVFDNHVHTAQDEGVEYHCSTKTTCGGEQPVAWRGWESPRSGHVYELEGPDAGAVGMAPAPRVGSSELSAEMAEVYGLALLRDVPFTEICRGGDKKLCDGIKVSPKSELSAQAIVDELNAMPFYSGKDVVSSTPEQRGPNGFNRFERNRRFARTQSIDEPLTPETAFRGSTPGALAGPYISQFMLIGAPSLACDDEKEGASFVGKAAKFGIENGFVPYGSLVIDQRTLTQRNCLDYMTDWCSWLDVQNGANFKGADQFEEKRRFITTPRDLATYVHFDALYEAYLNACLLMLAMGVPTSKGFPEPSATGVRDAFATFGGPHILSLVTEVATRCLKSVRRQKFNYHRRARPEAIGGRLTLSNLGLGGPDKLGCASGEFQRTLDELPEEIKKAIVRHNREQNALLGERRLRCDDGSCLPDGVTGRKFGASNLLLPMAFPEGSPMHPAYGAGHATVAGGCVTMLKAFFEMFEDCHSFRERKLCDADGNAIAYVPTTDGARLTPDAKSSGKLTVQGELDKLAANISIGRNMAGVHYYSDYYDSLRMGERIAVGILLEQAPSYGETVACSFTSFDGDHITLSGEGASCPSLSVTGRDGERVTPESWWLRHVSGREFSEDL